MYATPVRVLFADTDAMGVVNNANYLTWFEAGRGGLMRALGIPYVDFVARSIHVPLVEAHLKYIASAKYDDEVQVETVVAELSPARLKFVYRVVRPADGRLLCEGWTVHGFIGADGRAVALPKVAPDLYRRLQERLEP